ncbi:hypothetical protein PQR75_34110 [Paraburkholderia fungorum]|uniref:hypothetical protein n=1 Tax=Paraburkholderia fungorum TaxID=134537 RepID=UPI0038BDD393
MTLRIEQRKRRNDRQAMHPLLVTRKALPASNLYFVVTNSSWRSPRLQAGALSIACPSYMNGEF